MTKRKGPAAALQRSPAQPPRARRSAHAQLQARCVDWFDTNYPSLRPLRHASAGGVYLGRAQAAAAKREGIVNKGELDLAFSGRSKDERFIGLAIELKANAADRLTTEQKQTITVLLDMGLQALEVRSFEEFKSAITEYYLHSSNAVT